MIINKNFICALKDYYYLINKKYSINSVLKLIGDRYLLNSTERNILYRGVTTKININRRKNKKIFFILKKSNLYIDGYNVFFTISSYLLGFPTFICLDGFLRDASEIHRSIIKREIFEKSIELVINYLKKNKFNNIVIFLDKQMSNSGELSNKLNILFKENCINGYSQTTNSTDFELKSISDGYCATSDSDIIDKTNVKIIDLSRKILEYFYKPKFINLKKVKL